MRQSLDERVFKDDNMSNISNSNLMDYPQNHWLEL